MTVRRAITAPARRRRVVPVHPKCDVCHKPARRHRRTRDPEFERVAHVLCESCFENVKTLAVLAEDGLLEISELMTHNAAHGDSFQVMAALPDADGGIVIVVKVAEDVVAVARGRVYARGEIDERFEVEHKGAAA